MKVGFYVIYTLEHPLQGPSLWSCTLMSSTTWTFPEHMATENRPSITRIGSPLMRVETCTNYAYEMTDTHRFRGAKHCDLRGPRSMLEVSGPSTANSQSPSTGVKVLVLTVPSQTSFATTTMP